MNDRIFEKRRNIFILLALSALLTGLSVTFPKYLGAFEWVTMIPLAAALFALSENRDIKLRKIYLFGLFYFELFYMVGFHFFLYLYPLDFTGLDNFSSVLVILVAWLGLPFLQALFGGLMFITFAYAVRSPLFERLPVLKLFALPVIYSAYEFTQTLGWWGVPWSRLPLGQTEILLTLETAGLFGSYFVTALIVLVNSLLYFSIRYREKIKLSRILAGVSLSVFLLNFAAGGIIYLAKESEAERAEKITVGVVQGNYDSTEKWTSSPVAMLETHLEYTDKCIADGAKLVIWAETALPFSIEEGDYYTERISKTAEINEAVILVGCMQYEGQKSFNSILCFMPSGEISKTVYYKRHLVPFGEYVPMRSVIDVVLPFLSELSMLSEDMTAGIDSEIFETELGNFGSLICFDSIYETLAIDSVRDGAELIALSTNDSWFSDSAGIYMHNSQAKLRAIEVNRFVARSANTGVSSFITSNGESISEIPPLTEGYAVAELSLLDSRTLYSVTGNIFVYLCFMAISAVPIYSLVEFIISKKRVTLEEG